MELICKYLDRERFDVFVVSKIHREQLPRRIRVELGARLGLMPARAKKRLWAQMNARIPNFKALLGEDHVLFAQDDVDLRRILLELSPDILNVYYSGNPEPPTSDEEIVAKIPVTVTTNSFEIENNAPSHRHVRRIFFPSRWLLVNRATWAKDDPRSEVFYSPIEEPLTREDLRQKLGIPQDAFVIGRVGRPDPGIHDPISLKAFQQIQDDKTYFLALSPPENMLEEAKELKLKNFIPLPPVSQEDLSRFYNTIDVLAHARRDGETFGCNIAEAMMHGKPTVSHLTPYMNAQEEVIGDAGYVCAQDDFKTYAQKLALLRDDRTHRERLSKRALERAHENFEARALAKRLESTYLSLLNQR